MSQLLPSGRQPVMTNRVHWAITYLVKAGALVRPKRGHFQTTDRGKTLLRSGPKRITMKELDRFDEFTAFRPPRSTDALHARSNEEKALQPNDQTPEDKVEAAISEIDDLLRAELLKLVLAGSPAFFERLVVDLLVAMGYGGSRKDAARQIGRSGDEGIDGVIDGDALGLDVVYMQAKRYDPANSIGREKIQQFAGALVGQGANKGVFVTTSSFTTHAVEYAQRIPQRVVLVDGRELTDHMMRYKVGVRVVRTFEHRHADLDYFDAE